MKLMFLLFLNLSQKEEEVEGVMELTEEMVEVIIEVEEEEGEVMAQEEVGFREGERNRVEAEVEVGRNREFSILAR